MSLAPALDTTTGFSLTVPASWIELELRPHLRAAEANRLADERTRDVPELRPHRAAIAKLLRELAGRAWDSGAAYCAMMAEPTADGVLTASVTVTATRAPVGSDGDAAALLAPLRPLAPTAEGWWRELGMVDLPYAGTASRVSGVDEVALEPGGPSTPVVAMQTFVPVAGSDRVLIVSASSPALAIAPVMLDLFDAVTSTLRVLGPVVERTP